MVLACRFPESLTRPQVRQLLRQAVCDYMRERARQAGQHWLPAQLVLHGEPGQPPLLHHPALPAAGGVCPAQTFLSFSHQPGYSLAALCRSGPVGVDLMRIEVLPDWQALAADYLPPAVARQLAARSFDRLPALSRATAFAVAWTHLEACLKCLGQPLGEWTPARAADFARLRVLPLALPDGWAGTLAVAADTTFSA